MSKKIAKLALSDGSVYTGVHCGAQGEVTGELVFNTTMAGYQEVMTDPSYCGQLMAFSYPHIGNVGYNEQDWESNKVHTKGVVVKEVCKNHSNYRAKGSFEEFLQKNNVVGIEDIDTRDLVKKLRVNGSLMAVISSENLNDEELVAKAKSLESLENKNLVKEVSTDEVYKWNIGEWDLAKNDFITYFDQELLSRPHVVVVDCGVKRNILRILTDVGFRVTVVPYNSSVDVIEELKPDALFISNGPGDPAAVDTVPETIKHFIGKLPMFGICLGHQLIGLAHNAKTFKLKFGHHAANHPVRNCETKRVYISSQNHGFAVSNEDLPQGLDVSYYNLNDNTVSGFELKDKNAFSVQYHPEGAPGPEDSRDLFEQFFAKVA